MTIATVQLMSDTLWREVTYTALLPDADAGPGPYPVLYLLHGGNQSHTSWLLNSRLVRLTRSLPLLVVLPDGAQSRWANGRTPFTDYEDFLVEELAAHVARTFHVADGPGAIGGNSMGGFGAVRLGLKYPQRFRSVWAHSPCFVTADTLRSTGTGRVTHTTWTASRSPAPPTQQRCPRSPSTAGGTTTCLSRTAAFTPSLTSTASRMPTMSTPADTTGTTGMPICLKRSRSTWLRFGSVS
jgi:enterochelin esterase-like enzyme